MPRPRRSRATATRATATRLAKAPSPAAGERQRASSTTPSVAAQPAAPQARLPSSDIYDVSDREKERAKQRAAEAAAADAPQPRRTRASQHRDLSSAQAQALDESRRRRHAAMDRLDDLSSTSGPRHAESPAIIDHSRRETASSVPPRFTDASGLDLDFDDDVFGSLDDSLDATGNTIEEAQNGGRSTDASSFFSVAPFRRRHRQPSVAGKDDAPIRPSSRGQNTPSISTNLNFSNFKRRAREPSILATTRKPRTQRAQSQASQGSPSAIVAENGADSGPEGESTPLDRTRRQTRGSGAASPSLLPSRKRKSLESHEDGREKRPAALEPATAVDDEIIHQSIEIHDEPVLTPPRGRARQPDRFSTPVQDDDAHIMEPPLSSSSEGSSPVAWPSLDALSHRTYTRKLAPRALKTPERSDSPTDISSPPSLTHSPNYATAATTKAGVKKKTHAAPQKKVSTADLTSLLPRRRHKASNRNASDSNDPFDLDSSDDDDRYRVSAVGHDDEHGSRAGRRRRAQQPPSRSTSNRKGKEAAGGNRSKNTRNLRTYGTGNDDAEDEVVVGSGTDEEDDEEGQDDEVAMDETSPMKTTRERPGEELQKAARLFKEVDKWELSFEEVTEGSSPGPGAR